LYPHEKVERKDKLYMFSFFLFGVFFNQVFFLVGLNRTTPINSSLIMLVNPIMAIVFGVIILKEKLLAKRLAGVLIGLTGTAILILGDSGFSIGGGSVVGDIMILINATSWALFLVTMKKMMSKKAISDIEAAGISFCLRAALRIRILPVPGFTVRKGEIDNFLADPVELA